MRAALAELEAGRRAVLVSVVRAQGSAPRSTGAAMVAGEGGVLAGTIGGGALEYRCAREALSPREPLTWFDLSNRQAADLGMVCGGRAQVLCTPLTDQGLLRQGLDWLAAGRNGWLLLPLDGGAPRLEEGEALSLPGAAVVGREGGEVLALSLRQRARVYLFGGGHVALELARLLTQLDYPYITLDDRPEFSGPERFPGAMEALTAPYEELAARLSGPLLPRAEDAICIMTRGHLADAQVLRFALSTPAGYIGLMGSRSKREQVLRTLAEEGFADAPRRITTPIGLPIGGQTPAEVAVSVAAQLIQRRWGGKKG